MTKYNSEIQKSLIRVIDERRKAYAGIVKSTNDAVYDSSNLTLMNSYEQIITGLSKAVQSGKGLEKVLFTSEKPSEPVNTDTRPQLTFEIYCKAMDQKVPEDEIRATYQAKNHRVQNVFKASYLMMKKRQEESNLETTAQTEESEERNSNKRKSRKRRVSRTKRAATIPFKEYTIARNNGQTREMIGESTGGDKRTYVAYEMTYQQMKRRQN
jgi:hypothetical protein